MRRLNLPNAVFVDNSASVEVASKYLELLEDGVSVVTPNKLAASGGYDYFVSLKNVARKKGVSFLYETNVGAALPVIGTLRDLVNSGDKVLRIEGVLSGTLSYIFNSFDGRVGFSEVVKEAKLKGFTEPDPRDDLNCSDVARKILILARECGYGLEYGDVVVNQFLPMACLEAESVEEFWVRLKSFDGYFEDMRSKAVSGGGVLRCVARFEGGRAVVGLEVVSKEHSFYGLSGSDNVIAFTTSRYKERPLVIKGSGAGGEVTASGVFADIIKAANYL
jgi:aspartokinase/homoserine dehydrogenase 1